jgi:uncharacterized protein YkwD
VPITLAGENLYTEGPQHTGVADNVKQAYVLITSILVAVATAIVVSVGASPAGAAEGGMAKQCGGGQISLQAKEYETYKLHNRYRRDKGLPAFCVDPRLTRAAEAHSQDMMDRNYYSHDTKGSGTTFDQRIKREGYDFRAAAENTAWGSGAKGSPSSIMTAWKKSDPHRKNILNRRLREIGIGVADGNFQGYSNASVYTVDFGTKL